jgi:hypothetical protein
VRAPPDRLGGCSPSTEPAARVENGVADTIPLERREQGVTVGWGRCAVACTCLAVTASLLGGTAAAAARPSQANPAPAGDWARSVCGALITWRGDVEHAANDATAAAQKAHKLSDSAQVKQAKQAIVTFLGVAIDATTTAESNLQAIGEPPVTNSAGVEDALVASFDELVSFYQSSRAKAQAVSTKNAERAHRKLSSIAEAIASQSDEVESLMDRAITMDASGELSGAVAAEPQCADVLGGEA